jgi:hypothetical protein
MANVIEWCMVEGAGPVECKIETWDETLIHLFVDNVVCLASDEAGFEEVVAELTDTRIRCACICTGDNCIGTSE